MQPASGSHPVWVGRGTGWECAPLRSDAISDVRCTSDIAYYRWSADQSRIGLGEPTMDVSA